MPLRTEVKNNLYFVSDYAIARGASCSWDIKDRTADSASGRCCDIWLRQPANLAEGMVETCNLRNHRETSTRFTDFPLWKAIQNLEEHSWAYMDSPDVGVLPRIQNPAARGIDLFATDQHTKEAVAINHKISRYPQALVTNHCPDAVMNKTNCGALLSQLLATPGQTQLTEVGDYDGNKCYYFAETDNYYVYLPAARPAGETSIFRGGERCQKGQGYWFLCQPVAGVREADDSIQCREVLDVYPFETPERMYQHHTEVGTPAELDVNEFALGQWLQNGFLTNLEKSTTFPRPQKTKAKLCQVLQTRFVKHNLLTERGLNTPSREQ